MKSSDPRWFDGSPSRDGLRMALHARHPSSASLVNAFVTARLPGRYTCPADAYLQRILRRKAVDTSMTSPLRKVRATLLPVIQAWANGHLLSLEPSGSFSKGTANASGTDIDMFISVSPNVIETLREVYDILERAFQLAGYKTRRQNVSINITVDGWSVDLVPAKRQNRMHDGHSLYRQKADTWTKTNVAIHRKYVLRSGRTEEIRIIKLWRDQLGLDWPSFYLELVVIHALQYAAQGDLAMNVWKVFEFLRDDFLTARFVDPANTNNIISDELTMAEKRRIEAAGAQARATLYWRDIVV